MLDPLANRKTAFLWNWRDFPGGVDQVAQLLELGDFTAVAVKAHEGGEWFHQGESFRDIRTQLRAAGVGMVGSWGYHYFQDPTGELDKILGCLDYGAADFHILNIEDPAIERNPSTPAIAGEMFGALRREQPESGFYFCSHAQPVYHPTQPYYQAMQAGFVQMPMAYHTAMEMDPDTAVRVTRDGLEAYGLLSAGWNAAGALYGVPVWPILPGEVVSWGVAALAAGATGLTWWDLDAVQDRADLLAAVRQIPMTPCG